MASECAIKKCLFLHMQFLIVIFSTRHFCPLCDRKSFAIFWNIKLFECHNIYRNLEEYI